MKKDSVKPLDYGTVPSFKKRGLTPVSKRSPEDRQKDLHHVLNWILQGKPNDYDIAVDFKRIDIILPTRRGQTPSEMARDIESAMDFCRKEYVVPAAEPGDGASLPLENKYFEGPEPNLTDILTWIRNGKQDADDITGEFKKSKKSPEDLHKDLDSVLQWIRQGNSDDHDIADE